ncbi:MAG TPA: helix-turn-helix domain-containing protein [Ktedonobacteraceae bacterium]|nr:helix-turn-helix domain-containing protein [Ktedonobacteraceae bacterium]
MKKEEYYTAKEAMELLGKPSTSFYREVREGRIPHKGKRPNMRFPKEAIDVIAEVRANKKEEEENLTFILSTIADAWTKQEITHQPYEDEDAVPFKTVLEWRERNDEISMNVKLRGRILGWTTFLPLDETIIVELLYNRMREKDIPPQAIKKWTDRQLSVYIPIIEVIPSDNVERDKEVGAFLLKKTIKWAITLMIQYDIKNWYGIGATAEGQAILERLGFELITDLEGGKRKGYKLETKTEPVRLVSRFLQSI